MTTTTCRDNVVIAMSAQDRLQAATALMPVDDRLPKPFDLDHLYEKVAYWAAAS
jgi:DNA-binding response OmpR family regulator